jgi:hypothetical protein
MFRWYLLVSVLFIAGCGGKPSNEPTASEQALIQGELTESSYRDAVANILPQLRAAISDPELTEERLDRNARQIEALIELGGRLNLDKSELSEAELSSALGANYTRKAGFHSDNAREAGAFASAGFRYLDRAVAKYPNNINARINRGLTSASLPEFMNKSTVAIEDLRVVVASPEFVKLSPDLQTRVKSVLHVVESRAKGAPLRN